MTQKKVSFNSGRIAFDGWAGKGLKGKKLQENFRECNIILLQLTDLNSG